MLLCTECDVENDPITGKPDEYLTNKKETGVSAVQPTEHQTTKREVPTLEKLIARQAGDAYCREATTQVGKSSSELHGSQNGLLVRTTRINGCLSKVVRVLLRERILHAVTYSPIADHPIERGMFDTMQKYFFWPLMTNEVKRW